MATKHTATFDGVTFTRTSQNRVYTHMVVALYPIEAEVRGYANMLRECRRERTDEQLAQQVIEREAELRASKYVSSDGQHLVKECGWCSRLDLAQKLAAQPRKAVAVHIIETTRVVK